MKADSKLKEKIVEAFKKVLDPELGIDVWTLGLIYGFEVDEEETSAKVRMTFTTPLCPYGPQLVESVRRELRALGLEKAEVEVVFTPPWQPPPGLRETLGI